VEFQPRLDKEQLETSHQIVQRIEITRMNKLTGSLASQFASVTHRLSNLRAEAARVGFPQATKSLWFLLIRPSSFVFTLLMAGSLHGAGKSVSYYQSIYDREYQKDKAMFASMAASNWGDTYFTFQYPFAATLSMYEATKDLKYLQRALSWGQSMVSVASVIDNNGNKNWAGVWASPYSPSPIAYQLEELQGSTELARLARIILTNPTLRSAYGDQAALIYNFVRDQIIDKNLYKRAGGLAQFQRFLSNTASGVNDKPEFLINLLLDLKLANAASGGADDNAFHYTALLNDLARGLKDHNGIKPRFEPFNGGLIWDLGMGFEQPYNSVDTMHGNPVPSAIIELYRAGIVFDKSYLQGLADLFTKVIWNQSLTDPKFNNFINGSNGVFRNRGAWANGMIYCGWIKLAEFDAQTFAVADAVLMAILAGKTNPSLNYNNTIWGRVSLAGHLAKAAAAASSPSPISSPPMAEDESVTTSQDAPVDLTLNGSDPAGGALTFSIVTRPTHGTLNGTAPDLTYEPGSGYSGSDSFTFKVNNGQLDSVLATVSIAITAAPTTPSPFVTDKTPVRWRNDFSGWVGMKFTVGNRSLTVTALGRIFASRNSGTHTVKLVIAGDGTDVTDGSVTISMVGGTLDEFTYSPLTTPVTLAANTSYYLVSFEDLDGDGWYDNNTRVTTAIVGTCDGHVYGDVTWNEEYPDPGKTYGPVDFKYLK
jgi:hypothetical protein